LFPTIVAARRAVSLVHVVYENLAGDLERMAKTIVEARHSLDVSKLE
jgi:hypothetical protein